jgi:hypothetical protein
VTGFLTDLADVARSTGFTVVEWAGWRTRTRSSSPGGFLSGRPSHLMVHHTASNPGSDGNGDATFIWNNASTAPIYNVYIGRDARIFVGAAGPSNNAGNGSCSGRDGSAAWDGGVPDNAMNTHSIGVALANQGTGEPYPARQTDALVAFCRAATRAYGIPLDFVRGHREWTLRKVDMFGPSPWGAGHWDMNAFRRTVGAATPPPPPPGGITTEDEMQYVTNDGTGAIWVGNGITRRHVPNEAQFGALRWGAAVSGRPLRDWRTGASNPELGAITVSNADELAALGLPI